LKVREPNLDLVRFVDDMLCGKNISVGMDNESGAPTSLRLLGLKAGLGITLGDDTYLHNGWTNVVGEPDIGAAHTVELGLHLAQGGITPDRRGRGC
jgi:hypothetical protein